jgi:hypothetical protein
MKKTTILSVSMIGLASILAGLLIGSSIVNAVDTTNSGQALEISPPVIELKANPGQTIQTKVNLRDVSTTSLVVKSQINDFVASGEDGNPKILLDDTEVNPYSIKDWISPLSDLTLESKKTKDLVVTISVPSNASPGGYYGVVRFTATPPELEGTGLSLSASLGALILLRVNGDVKEEMTIESFWAQKDDKTSWLFESTPIQFVERLNNNGNTHEQPSGQITITDMFGNKVATVNVNMPVRNVLPQSIRKFEQTLDSSTIGNKVLFGRYKAELKMTYGPDNTVLTKSFEFWVIPYRLIILGVIIVVGGFFLLRYFIRRYNRHIIKKASKRK